MTQLAAQPLGTKTHLAANKTIRPSLIWLIALYSCMQTQETQPNLILRPLPEQANTTGRAPLFPSPTWGEGPGVRAAYPGSNPARSISQPKPAEAPEAVAKIAAGVALARSPAANTPGTEVRFQSSVFT